jgi:hypothetical protein
LNASELTSSYPLNTKSFSIHQKLFKAAKNIPFFLLVDRFLRFAQISFEKWQTAIYPFSKELCEHPRSLSTNRKKGLKIQKHIMNALVILKSFWCFKSIRC